VVHICRAAFFPPGLHPVLDGGEGDKDPVIAPEVPAGGLIGQAILDDESHGKADDAMGVMGFGQGVVGHVRVEVLSTTRATMLGVDNMDVARPASHQVANVMQDPLARSATKTGSATRRTGAMREIPGAANDLGWGQIIGPSDAFRGIREILSWSRHGKALLGQASRPRKLQDLRVAVIAKCLF
jgi:hypothetical protein